MFSKTTIRQMIMGLAVFVLLWSMCTLISAETKEERPYLCVKGILYDNNVPLALVNQGVVKVGDTAAGAKVVQINSSSVAFEYKGEVFEQQVGNCGKELAPLIEGAVVEAKKGQSSSGESGTAEAVYDTLHGRAPQLKLSAKEQELLAQVIAMMVAFLGIIVIVVAVSYIYTAIAFQIIARKTGTENGWLAWVPIANLYLYCRIADRPGWWLLLFFVPFVQIIIGIMVCMGIARARNKPSWLGILLALVPGINLIVLGYLAFSKDEVKVAEKAAPPSPPSPPKKTTGLTL